MLSYRNLYKTFIEYNSVKAQAAYNIYIAVNKPYKKELTLSKKCACENYIEKSSNKCKAA